MFEKGQSNLVMALAVIASILKFIAVGLLCSTESMTFHRLEIYRYCFSITKTIATQIWKAHVVFPCSFKEQTLNLGHARFMQIITSEKSQFHNLRSRSSAANVE